MEWYFGSVLLKKKIVSFLLVRAYFGNTGYFVTCRVE